MKVCSWYGLTGEIEVENQFWHLVLIGGVPLGRPPVSTFHASASDEKSGLS